MPILPIPACVDSLITGQDLKEGMVILCIIVIVLSLLPPLILFLLCSSATGDAAFDLSDPVSTSTFVALILAVIVLILLLLVEETPGIVHFILVIIWLIVAIWIAWWAVYMILHIGRFGDGACGIAHLVALICYIILALVMVYGVIVYWSFYAEND
ncbi:hypothetical protein WDU94_011151 [Cyamophila willieti]